MIGTDGVAYLRIAQYYAHGQTSLAISGYWGPLISWLMVPLLKCGLDPQTSLRCALGLSAVLFWAGCVAAFKNQKLPAFGQAVGEWLACCLAVYWSAKFVTPDLLVSALVLLAIDRTLAVSWPLNWKVASAAGLLWGFAYFAKAVAFPLAFLMNGAIAAWWILGKLAPRRNVLRSLLVTLLTFAIAVAPWVVILSVKYGKITFSTTGSIAHALVGPPDVRRIETPLRTFNVPESGRVASWEEPSLYPFARWSPLENRSYAAHQVKLILRNGRDALQIVRSFDYWGLGVLGLVGTLIFRTPYHRAVQTERWRCSLVPCVCGIGIYLPVLAYEMRYYFALYPFAFVAAWGFGSWLLEAAEAGIWSRRLATCVLLASFGVPATGQLSVSFKPSPYCVYARDLAKRMAKAHVTGPITGKYGIWVAYFLNQPYYGHIDNPTGLDYQQSPAQLFIVERSKPLAKELDQNPSFRNLDDELFPLAQERSNCIYKAYCKVQR